MANPALSIRSQTRIASCTVCTLLFCSLAHTANAGTLHVNARWGYSESDTGESRETQNYNVSYTGRADITELLRLNGSLRYQKSIKDNVDTDIISPTLSLKNVNDIYRFSLGGTYNFQTGDERLDHETWAWTSRLDSNWTNNLWPRLLLNYGQSGTIIDGIDQGTNDSAGFNASWNYLQWMQLYYNASWRDSEGLTSSSESLNQTASLNINRSFFDNRGTFSFGQQYTLYETDTTSATSGGIALVPVTISQVYYEETNDPFNTTLTNNASFLLNDAVPGTLTIDPSNPPMNIMLFNDFRDVQDIHIYTTVDISSFAGGISWQLYEGFNGTDDWTFEGNLVPIYDPVQQRFELDLGGVQNNRYIKLVADPSALLPANLTEIEKIELFRRVVGTGPTITTSTEEENWRSNLGLGYRLTENIQLSYHGNYDLREGSNTRERENISNSAGATWTPSGYFQARLNASDNRTLVENEEDAIGRDYVFSMTLQPLQTLGLGAGFRRSENYTGSTLDAASHIYTFDANAQLYRDLHASLNFSFTNPKKGVGSDTFSSDLYVTARLSPTLLLDWDSFYDWDFDSSVYGFSNTFRLNWRASDFMYFNARLILDDGSNHDLETQLDLSLGLTPNNIHRMSFGYTLEDKQDFDVRHTLFASWRWLMNRVFHFRLSGNYRFDEDDSWSFDASLIGRFL
jgi:hypothetical protein